MCLKHVEKTEVRTGYKVMRISRTGDFLNFDRPANESPAKVIGVWYTAEPIMINSDSDGEYMAGFHICTTKKGAAKYANYWDSAHIVKVLYRFVFNRGTQRQSNISCVTAYQMQIVEDCGTIREVYKKLHIGQWRRM